MGDKVSHNSFSTRCFFWRSLAAAAVAMCPAAGSAQSITIAPVTVSLASGQLTTTLSVANRGAGEVAIQVRAFEWSQGSGEDVLTPTENLLVSPPIATIRPGGSQTVRVLLRARTRDTETAYRLFIDEIPSELPANGVRVALRLSIPVFSQPGRPTRSDLVWTAIGDVRGLSALVVANHGRRHAHLSNVRLVTATGTAIAIPNAANFYVLPGATLVIRPSSGPISLQPGTRIRLNATSDEGDVIAEMAIAPRP